MTELVPHPSNPSLRPLTGTSDHPRMGVDLGEVLAAIVDRLPDPAYALDRSLRFVYMNGASRDYVRRVGLDPDAVLGTFIAESFPSMREAGLIRAIERVRDKGVATEPVEHHANDGRWYAVSFLPAGGCIVGINQDITPLKDAENAHRRTLRLQAVTAALSSALTSEAVGRAIVGAGRDVFGAPAGTMSMMDASGRALTLIYGEGHAHDVLEAWRTVPIDANAPIAEAARTRQVVSFATAQERVERYGAPPPPGFDGGVSVPLVVDDRVLGAWGLSFAHPTRLGEEDLEFLRALGRQAAQAVARAELLRANQSARRRAAFLAEASEALAGSLDYHATLQSVARLAVPLLGDWCLVDVLTPGDEIELVAVANSDPARTVWGRRVHEAFPPALADRGGIGHVLRTGESAFVPEIRQSLVLGIATSETMRAAIAEIGPRSFMCVAMRARERVVGAITLLTTRESGRRYGPDDLALAEELARRAATTVDHVQLYREAVDANAAKANFLAVVSHELRTPLTAVIGYTELLSEGIAGPVTDMQRDHLARIRASSTHLLTIIEEILAFSRLEAGRETVHRAAVDLREVVRSSEVLVAPLLERKDIRMIVAVPSDPVIVNTDAAKIRQILLNLLTNALKFTDRGEVRLELRLEPERAVLSVTDTGIGIARENRDRIFDPFWQVEQPTTRRVGGTGLGLSVVRQLTELLGGTLELESAPGEGARFEIGLPLR